MRLLNSVILLCLSIYSLKVNAQNGEAVKSVFGRTNQVKTDLVDKLELKLNALFNKTMREQQIPGAAIIIVKDGKVLLKKGYGFTKLGEGIRHVDPDSTIFRIGSVSKSLTALSLLQQIDKNKINLHDNVNTHLTSFKIKDTYKTSITPFHLLTHSAGFDELKGRRVFDEENLIPLGIFLKDNLKRIREPGEVTAYSTYGIALSGLLVENVSGFSLENYMNKHIWKPLKMNMTSITIPKRISSNVALGYELHNNINIPQPWEWYHTFPASSINSTVADMGKYMMMLLNKGSLENQRILSERLTSRMLTQQTGIHPETDGFTFGLYKRKWNGISSVNHGGDMLGYSSFMSLIPKENLGIFVVHHHEGTKLRHQAIQTVIDEIVGKYREKKLIVVEEKVNEFAGKYIWLSNCQTCLTSTTQKSWTLKANDDYTLSGFNRKFYKAGPLVFKSTDGKRTMTFKKDKLGNIKYMSLGNVNVFQKL